MFGLRTSGAAVPVKIMNTVPKLLACHTLLHGPAKIPGRTGSRVQFCKIMIHCRSMPSAGFVDQLNCLMFSTVASMPRNGDINVAPDQCAGNFAPNECQCQALTAHKRSHSLAPPQRQGALQASQRKRSRSPGQCSNDATSQRPPSQRPPSQRTAPQRPGGAAGQRAAGARGRAGRAHTAHAGRRAAPPGQCAERPEGFDTTPGLRAEVHGLVLAQPGPAVCVLLLLRPS